MTNPLPVRVVLVAMVALLAAGPLFLEEFYVELVISMMILGIFAMSLDLLIGFTGLVSFGHAAFFGLAGYLLAIVTPQEEAMSIWFSLPISLVGTALAALVIGWFSVRTSGIYFIMITLAFAQMFYYYFNENLDYGGSDGIFIYSKPLVGWGEVRIIDFENINTMYFFVLASLVGCYFLLSMILKSPFGQVIKGIRANEHRTRALGFKTIHYKLVAFVIAGTLAGYAGYLEAASTGIVSPGHLHWHQSGMVMMLVILGGMGTLYGPVLGAFAMEFLRDYFQDVTEHWHLYQGLFVIAVVLFLPHGIAGLVARLAGRARKRPPDAEEEEAGP
jgi:branched-chain amino acid transport system permease protein